MEGAQDSGATGITNGFFCLGTRSTAQTKDILRDFLLPPSLFVRISTFRDSGTQCHSLLRAPQAWGIRRTPDKIPHSWLCPVLPTGSQEEAAVTGEAAAGWQASLVLGKSVLILEGSLRLLPRQAGQMSQALDIHVLVTTVVPREGRVPVGPSRWLPRELQAHSGRDSPEGQVHL